MYFVFIKESIFFYYYVDFFVLFWQEYFGIQFNGVGGVVVEWIIVFVGYVFLLILKFDSWLGVMFVVVDGVGVNLGFQFGVFGFFQCSCKDFIVSLFFLKFIGQNIYEMKAFFMGCFEENWCIGFFGF